MFSGRRQNWSGLQEDWYLGLSLCKWLYLDSEGASSGILIMGDARRMVEKVEEAIGLYLVSCRFRNVGD